MQCRYFHAALTHNLSRSVASLLLWCGSILSLEGRLRFVNTFFLSSQKQWLNGIPQTPKRVIYIVT